MYKLKHLHSVYLLSFVSGLHTGLIKIAVTLWLRMIGVELIYLGLLNLAFLPYSMKILWMPFLESKRLPLGIFKYRKDWLFFLELIICVLVFGLSLIAMYMPVMSGHYFFVVCVYIMILACFTTTKESMAIAYQMEVIDSKLWGKTEGVTTAFYDAALWTAGILLFYLSGFFHWYALFFSLGMALFALCFFQLFIPNSRTYIKKEQDVDVIVKRFVDPYLDLFKRKRNIILPLFLFMSFYKLQDRMMVMTNYFVLDIGFSRFDFFCNKSFGLIVTIFGALISSLSIRKFGFKSSLIYGMIGQSVACAMFFVQSIIDPSYLLFYVMLISEKFVKGYDGNVFFTYQMFFCDKHYLASQFTILAATDRLIGTIFTSLSGFVIVFFGWWAFFLFTFIGVIPSYFLLKRLPDWK